jgi:hypothetical protein
VADRNRGRAFRRDRRSGAQERRRQSHRHDGPFAETKEVIGGYAVLKAANKDEVIELTRRFLDEVGQGTWKSMNFTKCRRENSLC